MECNTNNQDGFVVVSLGGDVDLASSPTAREAILSSLEQGDVLVDLSAVNYIDSSGVASLVEGYQNAKDKSRRFGLVGVSESAIMVLQLAHLDKVFPIYDTVADAAANG
jgi:anti-sigma B factor antagonist